MYAKQLNRFRHLILEKQYVVTTHAYDEIGADGLTVWDMESIILTGNILEKQADRDTGDSKYRIGGKTLSHVSGEVIVKQSVTGKLVIITVYAL